MLEFKYPRSQHEAAVDDVFGEAAIVPETADKMPCVILGFTNRSGSNYLAELLRATGRFRGLSETLNEDPIRTLTAKSHATSFAEYLDCVARRFQGHPPEAIWGCKASWQQLTMLLRTRAIPNKLQPTVVFIQRRDLVAQAVSLYLAAETGQWASFQAEPLMPRSSVPYNGSEILKILRGIMQSTALFSEVCAVAQLPVTRLFYEDLLADPRQTIADLTKQIIGDAVVPASIETKIKQQRDAINDEFKSRFLADLGEINWSATI